MKLSAVLFYVLFALGEFLVAAQREYYKLLGVPTKATAQEIKKAFRVMSKKYHPDLNHEPGADEKYSKINHAYEVLSDPEKRRVYDSGGEEGLKRHEQNQHSGGHDPFGGLFGNFFGQQQGERRGPDLPIKIRATLEDIYNGREIDVFVTKRVICPHCRGTGADNPDDVKTCPDCGGSGRVIKKQQIAPGFFQQFQGECERCGGKGHIFSTKCHVCHGNKLVEGMDEISLFIEKGIGDRQEMRFERAHEEYADMAPSDIVFKIIEVPHPVFKRKGNDLYTTVRLTLQEALLGFKKEIKHLDDHTVQLARTTVTQPGEVQKIVGEGMPHHEYSSNFGDLYVDYQIDFPTSFNEEQKKLWEKFFENK